MKYQIYYHYNNGTTYKEEVSAPNAIKALKKAGAHNYLKNVMFQNGSKGTAKAYEYMRMVTKRLLNRQPSIAATLARASGMQDITGNR